MQDQRTCRKCGETKPLTDFFHVDHDHETGEIRGILCGFCNVGIGLLKESTDVIRAAADYLERPRPVIPDDVPDDGGIPALF